MTVRAIRMTGSIDCKAGIRALTLAVAPMLALASHQALAERTWNYTYTDSGQLETVDGPRVGVNDVTTYGYDSSNNLISREDALGHMTRYADYSALGLPRQITDANGVVTDLTYDWRGNITSRTIATGSGTLEWTYEYDPVGQLIAVTDPGGQVLSYTYDAARRLTSITIASVGSVEMEYDAMGNVTAQTIEDASGVVAKAHTQAFDELGRLIRSIQADGDTTRYSYDVNSNLTSVIDANSQETQRAYDALDRLSRVTDPLQGQITFTYDAEDNLTSVTDAKGLTTQYEYNFAGDVTALTSPDTGTTSFEYDNAGNVTRRVDARGVETLYEYDALNRVTSVQYPDNPGENIAYQYDDTTNGNFGVGRLTGIVDQTGQTLFRYDALGRVVQEQRIIEDQTYTVQYAYTASGNLAALTYPSGRVVNYLYDSEDRLEQITTVAAGEGTAQTVLSEINHLPFGPVKGYTYGNGISRQLTYNQDYELTGQDSAVLSRTYAYDGIGNIVGITDALDPDQSQTFSYDPMSRLTQAIGDYGQIDYSYDANGNRLTRNITDGSSLIDETYTYATDSHRLLNVTTDDNGSVSERGFSYDAAGNTVQDARPDQTLDLVYNQQNRLNEVQSGGETTALYLHNALGQRVVKVATDPAANLHFNYDQAGHLLAESAADGQLLREYIYLNDTPVALIEADAGGSSEDLIIDNADSATSSTGTWTPSSTQPGYYGDGYLYSLDGDGSNVFHWQPSLSEEATYTVYARWTSHANRASDATYTISYDGTQHQAVVDQRSNGGQWQALGSYSLGPGVDIQLTNDADDTVIADAIKVEKTGS
ncbi:golvesin C-terminal-like domain-containing protein [Marinobacter bohaiensis]|uniref:golvesin C-terminal-like domain-containing protein n=1 Tax=Marinobacter bohaiensis TaxID=2201898 RepID=UPI000DAD769F|nr:hypothetical protein [Marinobacter bohaiensis]